MAHAASRSAPADASVNYHSSLGGGGGGARKTTNPIVPSIESKENTVDLVAGGAVFEQLLTSSSLPLFDSLNLMCQKKWGFESDGEDRPALPSLNKSKELQVGVEIDFNDSAPSLPPPRPVLYEDQIDDEAPAEFSSVPVNNSSPIKKNRRKAFGFESVPLQFDDDDVELRQKLIWEAMEAERKLTINNPSICVEIDFNDSAPSLPPPRPVLYEDQIDDEAPAEFSSVPVNNSSPIKKNRRKAFGFESVPLQFDDDDVELRQKLIWEAMEAERKLTINNPTHNVGLQLSKSEETHEPELAALRSTQSTVLKKRHSNPETRTSLSRSIAQLLTHEDTSEEESKNFGHNQNNAQDDLKLSNDSPTQSSVSIMDHGKSSTNVNGSPALFALSPAQKPEPEIRRKKNPVLVKSRAEEDLVPKTSTAERLIAELTSPKPKILRKALDMIKEDFGRDPAKLSDSRNEPSLTSPSHGRSNTEKSITNRKTPIRDIFSNPFADDRDFDQDSPESAHSFLHPTWKLSDPFDGEHPVLLRSDKRIKSKKQSGNQDEKYDIWGNKGETALKQAAVLGEVVSLPFSVALAWIKEKLPPNSVKDLEAFSSVVVERLMIDIHNSKSVDFQMVWFWSLDYFTEQSVFLVLLLRKILESPLNETSDQKEVSRRKLSMQKVYEKKLSLLAVLLFWVRSFPEDFDLVMRSDVLATLRKTVDAPWVNILLQEHCQYYYKKMLGAWKQTDLRSSKTRRSLLNVSLEKQGDILAVSPKECAEQLTILCLERLKRLGKRMYMKRRYELDATDDPHRWTDLSIRWVAGEILFKYTAEARAKMFAKWIEIAYECFLMGNFNSAFEISVGICNPHVVRLQDLVESLPAKALRKFTFLREIADPAGTSKLHASEFDKFPVDKRIPVLSTIVKNIFLCETALEACDDYTAKLKQCGKICEFLRQIEQAKHSKYSLRVNEELNELFRSRLTVPPSYDSIKDRSEELKPRVFRKAN
eukprot:TRINITY_DN78867_c0_g1_i1.p1 TRINITY_DN78867_c0_g1~~TRINITY_DN78867_c0_g1_i1.p1  ORF type:complete len:1013 (+),score=278.95 TRINITY_DN78867_c0_g1_i1:80-3040(+)